ncbi:phosphate ABC transporter permease PstA [Thermogemmatispora sp.]|uniref:phosphate ABC transporter permease PstA n=1 Tax=Thermogemmatispora sp. TaxID=1968838 RepID=UPI00257B945F|nr:phosphate ABC transporter permease PstA [Thermogemmatispora sp.]
MIVAVSVAVFVLYFILYVIHEGLPFLNLAFFTQPPTALGDPGGGVVTAIIGSLLIVGTATLIGAPLGLLTGIYLAEFGNGTLAMVIRFLVDSLAGLPTIIVGLFIWVLVVVPAHSFSGLAGALALAIIMIPLMTRTTEEVIRLVPTELRHASAALGATPTQTMLRVILPAARSGLLTGLFLAIARVAGETAPLLMTAFGSPFLNTNLALPMDALPLRIFTFTLSPYAYQIHQAYAGSLVLLGLVILASLLIRWVLRRTLPGQL